MNTQQQQMLETALEKLEYVESALRANKRSGRSLRLADDVHEAAHFVYLVLKPRTQLDIK